MASYSPGLVFQDSFHSFEDTWNVSVSLIELPDQLAITPELFSVDIVLVGNPELSALLK